MEPKKLAILRIWQILQKHSDYDHPLTQEDIIQYLESEYGIEMERKAIGKNIADLRDAGIDIGFTLIGMHLKRVAVPLRLENDRIGEAKVLAARVRPKFIGGSRAVYDDKLL